MSDEPFHVLVFTKTAGYRHDSIPAAIAAWERLAQASRRLHSSSPGFHVTSSEDGALFTPERLSAFRVIVLQHVTGEFLDAAQLAALKAFVRSGRGVVGIHTATTGMPSDQDAGCVDTEGWYERMIGAAFDGHPEPQEGIIKIEDPSHPILTRGLGGQGDGLRTFTETGVRRRWFDEWYDFKTPPGMRQSLNARILLSVDESTYKGGKLGRHHALIWCHEFEGGRVFQTALGHFDEAYEDDMFLGQVLGGLLWAAGFL
ncbi:hypothetical protein QQS21_007548 [Conoideocrella luteorostrata]|uniref:ThuA-like domain-containing protein n=1 Tax=Conoideocrella luteorostrata TaxID=1105319 RepID=A0AAJ0FZD8_9HYPO|nr:hypothetical protein QQS21_007548 [Conoideocrella luteorostrata]